jgi:hypothetical protein
MKVIKMRDNSAIFVDKDIDIDTILGSNKRFIKIGNMIINRVDITAVVSKEQYDTMVKQSNGMILTSQGWMGKREFANNSFLNIQIPEEMRVTNDYKELEDIKTVEDISNKEG